MTPTPKYYATVQDKTAGPFDAFSEALNAAVSGILSSDVDRGTVFGLAEIEVQVPRTRAGEGGAGDHIAAVRAAAAAAAAGE